MIYASLVNTASSECHSKPKKTWVTRIASVEGTPPPLPPFELVLDVSQVAMNINHKYRTCYGSDA